MSADVDATGPPRDARGGARVEVRRSRRRRRTVSAYRDGDRTIVLIPARFTRAEEDEWVATMLDRLARQDRRRRPSDAALARRAGELSARYLGGCARPRSVTWVDNQTSRWGSCTPSDASIRISSRVRGMPAWVLDYVLLHELAHLLEPRHGPAFWALLESYPRTERARGYLEGISAAAGLDLGEGDDGMHDPVDGLDDDADEDAADRTEDDEDDEEDDDTDDPIDETDAQDANREVGARDVNARAAGARAGGSRAGARGGAGARQGRL